MPSQANVFKLTLVATLPAPNGAAVRHAAPRRGAEYIYRDAGQYRSVSYGDIVHTRSDEHCMRRLRHQAMS